MPSQSGQSADSSSLAQAHNKALARAGPTDAVAWPTPGSSRGLLPAVAARPGSSATVAPAPPGDAGSTPPIAWPAQTAPHAAAAVPTPAESVLEVARDIAAALESRRRGAGTATQSLVEVGGGDPPKLGVRPAAGPRTAKGDRLLRAAKLRARARLERRGQPGLSLLAKSVRARLSGGGGSSGEGVQLYERSTDDAEVCGLACGNATRCTAACRRERARLHGWAGPVPTDDEAACTQACGPLAPHCVRACAAQRAAVHGWAGPVPTADEAACTPRAPQCVR